MRERHGNLPDSVAIAKVVQLPVSLRPSVPAGSQAAVCVAGTMGMRVRYRRTRVSTTRFQRTRPSDRVRAINRGIT